MKRIFRLSHDIARANAVECVRTAKEGWIVEVKEPTRTLEQNALMWPLLEDISKQVDWYGQRLTDEEWKDVLTAALKKQKAVPGIDGGFVVLGTRTSRMSKADFSELVELIYAFGAEHGVKFRTDQERGAA